MFRIAKIRTTWAADATKSEGGLGPSLYKEWKLTPNAVGIGLFGREADTHPARMRLHRGEPRHGEDARVAGREAIAVADRRARLG